MPPNSLQENLEQTDTRSSAFNVRTAPTAITLSMWQRFKNLFRSDLKPRRRSGYGSSIEGLEPRLLMTIPAEIRMIDASGNYVNQETNEQLFTRAISVSLEGTDSDKAIFLTGLDAMDLPKQEALLLRLESTLATTNSTLSQRSNSLAALPGPSALPWTADAMQWGPSGNADLAGKIAKTGDYVRSVTMAPDGTRVAIADGKNIKMLDAKTGSAIWYSNAHNGNIILQTQFSKDGTKIVSQGFDKGVTMLNAANGAILWQTPIGQYINHIAWSPDQTKIVVSDYGGKISTIDVASGTVSTVASDPNYWHAEFAPDGSLMLGNDKTLELRNPQTQAVTKTFQSPFKLHDASYQPNGNLVAATPSPNAAADGRIVFWDKTTGNQVALVNTGDIRVWKAEFSPNGKMLAAVTNNSGVFLYSVNGTTVTQMKQLSNMGEITDVAFSVDGSALVISTQTGTYLFKTSDLARTPVLAPESAERASLRVEVEGLTQRKTALQSMTTSVDTLLDAERASFTFTVPMGPEQSPENDDPEQLSDALLDQTVLTFLENQQQESESIGNRTWERLTFEQGGITSMALSPGNDRIAVARANGTVRFLTASTGEEVGIPLTLTGHASHLSYLPNGNLLVASGSTLTVVSETGDVLHTVNEGADIGLIRVLGDGSFVVVTAVSGNTAPKVITYSAEGVESTRKTLPIYAGTINVTSDGKTVTYGTANGLVTEALAQGGANFTKDFSAIFGYGTVTASASQVSDYGGRMVFAVQAGQNANILITDMNGNQIIQPFNLGIERRVESVTSVGGNFFLVDMTRYNPVGRETKLFELRMDAFVEIQSTSLPGWRNAPLSLSPDGQTVLTGGMDTVMATSLPQSVAEAEALRIGASRIGNAVISDGRLDNAEGRQLIGGQRDDLLLMAAEQGDTFNFRYPDERVWQKFMAANPGWSDANKAAAMTANHWSSDYFSYARGLEYEAFRTKIGSYQDATGRMMEAGMNALLADIKGFDPTAALAGLRSIPADARYGQNFQKLSQIGIQLPSEAAILEACRKILINCGEEYAGVQNLYQGRVTSAVQRMESGSYAGTGEATDAEQAISETRTKFLEALEAAQSAIPMFTANGVTIIGYGGVVGAPAPSVTASGISFANGIGGSHILGTVKDPSLHGAASSLLIAYDDNLTDGISGSVSIESTAVPLITQARNASANTSISSVTGWYQDATPDGPPLINGLYTREDSVAGRAFLAAHQKLLSLKDNQRELMFACARIEAVTGVNAVNLYSLVRSNARGSMPYSEYVTKLQQLFTNGGYGAIFSNTPEFAPMDGIVASTVNPQSTYSSGSIKIAIDRSMTLSNINSIQTYVSGMSNGNEFPLGSDPLTVNGANSLVVDIPVSAIGRRMELGHYEGPLRIKAAIWLNEQDSNGQLKHLGTTVYGVDVEWEAPTANQQIADYINNTILPSLTPVYGSDGTTIVEWVSPDAGAGGQCKTWVQQNLIPSIFGENVIIPRTNGDDLSKWTLQNNDLIEVNHISGFTSETALETIKTHFSSAVKGDLVQMYMRYVNGDEGPHTMVVLDITTSGLLVIDSNYRFDGTIRIHTISFDSMANSLIASTIYRATPNSL